VTLDLGPAIALQKRLSSGALFTGAMVYLEGIVVLVLVTETRFSPPFLIPVAAVMAAQTVLVREPVRLLVRGRLVASYVAFLLLAGAYVALAALGSRSGDERSVAALLSALVVGATAWPVISTIRAARASSASVRRVANPAVLHACLSFEVQSTISRRLRAFGGEHKRWATPFAVALASGAACLIALALVQQMLGLKLGALIGQAAGLAAMWAFYRTMRHTKPRAGELRAKDARPPVLILREFGDDALGAARLNPGRSFEHLSAAGESCVSAGRRGIHASEFSVC
jgi:hypothetical protein